MTKVNPQLKLWDHATITEAEKLWDCLEIGYIDTRPCSCEMCARIQNALRQHKQRGKRPEAP
jgi:hypothetical protein